MPASIHARKPIARSRPLAKPSEITANAPPDMPDHYLRRRLERTAEERAAAIKAIEDRLDAELAAERLRAADAEEAVPWDEAEKELGLG